jgi:hypothetical protein
MSRGLTLRSVLRRERVSITGVVSGNALITGTVSGTCDSDSVFLLTENKPFRSSLGINSFADGNNEPTGLT